MTEGSEEKVGRGFVFQLEMPRATTELLKEICHINKGEGIGPFLSSKDKDRQLQEQNDRVGMQRRERKRK